jgi:hypothetical protein
VEGNYFSDNFGFYDCQGLLNTGTSGGTGTICVDTSKPYSGITVGNVNCSVDQTDFIVEIRDTQTCIKTNVELVTPTPTASVTPTLTQTPTNTASQTPTLTKTPTNTPSVTTTITASPTNTLTPTSTPIWVSHRFGSAWHNSCEQALTDYLTSAPLWYTYIASSFLTPVIGATIYSLNIGDDLYNIINGQNRWRLMMFGGSLYAVQINPSGQIIDFCSAQTPTQTQTQTQTPTQTQTQSQSQTPTQTQTQTPTPSPTPACFPSMTGDCSLFITHETPQELYYYNLSNNTNNFLMTLSNGCAPESIVFNGSKMYIMDGCSYLNEYDYTISSGGCWSSTYVQRNRLFNSFPSVNAAYGIGLKDSNTLFVGNNDLTGTTIYEYNLTTSGLTKYMEVGNNAFITSILYNTGNTQMVLSYQRPNFGNVGAVEVYTGTTLMYSIATSQFSTNARGLYWNGTDIIGINSLNGGRYRFNFSAGTTTQVLPSISFVGGGIAYVGGTGMKSVCQNFNIP